MLLISLLISISLIIHYAESLIPVPIPGAKIGLANIMQLLTLVLLGPIEAFAVMMVRSVLGALFLGNLWAALYSFTGGTLSLIAMSILYSKFKDKFSLVGISTIGSAFHNIGQLLVASLVFDSFGIFFSYLPILMLLSLITGTFTGLVAHYSILKLNIVLKS